MKNLKENSLPGISRRQFIVTAGSMGFVITASAIGPGLYSKKKSDIAGKSVEEITAWVQIGTDGRIVLYNPAAEMGQGSMTALAAIIAEELDADWNKVHIENAPVTPEIYGLQWGGKLGGPMMTAGSRTIRGYYKELRMAGAQARLILLTNVAAKWKVPITELTTDKSIVYHKSSDRKIGYGEIISFISLPDPLPQITEQDLKDVSTFSIIGHVIPRFDIPYKVNGSAQYAIDIQLPGMVYASMSRSPMYGAKPELLNEKDIRATKGVIDVVHMDHGLAIVAKTYEQALKAKKSLQIKWTRGIKAEGYNSAKSFAEYQAMVTNEASPKIKMVFESGDADAQIKSATKVYSRDYFTDYLCHAQMEPLNLVVSLTPDGQSAHAWVGTQAPDADRRDIAKVLDLDESKVVLHTCYLGGGFGRRSGFAAELLKLLKK